VSATLAGDKCSRPPLISDQNTLLVADHLAKSCAGRKEVIWRSQSFIKRANPSDCLGRVADDDIMAVGSMGLESVAFLVRRVESQGQNRKETWLARLGVVVERVAT